MIESERRDRVCRVTPETGKRADLVDVLGKDPPVLGNDCVRGGMQITRAR